MAEDNLSQDELDTLLDGVPAGAEDEVSAEVKPFNLASERIVRGRMPTMEVINERFARLFQAGLFPFLRRTAEVTVQTLESPKYGDFIKGLMEPASLNLVSAKPLRGTVLIVLEPILVSMIVDTMFGSDGRFKTVIKGREYTLTEQRIILRVLEIFLDCYSKSWEPVYKVDFEFVRSESNINFVNITSPNEVVIVSSFKVEVGNQSGHIYFCMPNFMIEPIRALLTSTLQGESGAGVDVGWSKLMSQQVMNVELELKTNLTQKRMTLKEVVGMKKGEFIAVNIPDELEVTVNNSPVMACRYGQVDGKYALMIKRFLKANSAEFIPGESNVD